MSPPQWPWERRCLLPAEPQLPSVEREDCTRLGAERRPCPWARVPLGVPEWTQAHPEPGGGRAPVSAPPGGERPEVGPVVVVVAWRLPDSPLLSAGEAFLGGFVASGVGPSASSHGSPVPLPSDLSFRSPTPSSLPMVQLWAAHAHEGKECLAGGCGLLGCVPSTSRVSPPLLLHGHPAGCGRGRWGSAMSLAPRLFLDARCFLLSRSHGLCTRGSLACGPPTPRFSCSSFRPIASHL